MVGESNQNVLLIQKVASSFAEFEISEFELSRFDCSIGLQLMLIYSATLLNMTVKALIY